MRLKSFVLICIVAIVLILSTSCAKLEALTDSFTHLNEAQQFNETGYELLEAGHIDESIKYFYYAIDHIESTNGDLRDLDAPYNNLSWAYFQLGDYVKSLSYIEKALAIEPNDHIEYVNKGNALYGLGRYEEALQNYIMAQSINRHSYNAYYGEGTIYFEYEQYEKAIEAFNTYLSYQADDFYALEYIVYSYLYLGESIQALRIADDFLNDNEDNYYAYELKGVVLEWTSDYDDVRRFYERVVKQFPDLIEPKMRLAENDYYFGFYHQAATQYAQLIEKDPLNLDLYVWLIYTYSALGELDKAEHYFNQGVQIDHTAYELYNAIGNAYLDHTLYMESIQYFDQSIELNPHIEDSYLHKLYALYFGNRYSLCIEYGKQYMNLFAYSSNIPWFIGESYYELGEYEEAIYYYEKAFQLNPSNDTILADMAFAYTQLDDVDNAEKYSAQGLMLNPENEGALFVKDMLLERQQPLTARIQSFLKDNYLYYSQMNNFEHTLQETFQNESMSNREIATAIQNIRQDDDRFTYVIYGDDFDRVMNSMNNDVLFKQKDDYLYLKINEFGRNTSHQIIEFVDALENTEDAIFVVDLRDNFGGLTNESNALLDLFISDRVTSTLIDRDGHTFNYYSNASYVPFKHIYILTNENTASAAELFTLSMKTYLNNVTIVGQSTFGKGLGQHVFVDNHAKVMIFVTNHYWNIRQQNVMSSPIIPDVVIQGKELEDYLSVVTTD